MAYTTNKHVERKQLALVTQPDINTVQYTKLMMKSNTHLSLIDKVGRLRELREGLLNVKRKTDLNKPTKHQQTQYIIKDGHNPHKPITNSYILPRDTAS